MDIQSIISKIDVWKIVREIIIHCGGLSIFVFALVKLFGNKLLDRITKAIDQEYEKKIERYKTELEGDMYARKQKFDLYVNTYKELSGTSYEIFDTLKSITPNPDYLLTSFTCEDLEKKYNEIRDYASKIRPFVSEPVMQELERIICMLQSQMKMYQDTLSDTEMPLDPSSVSYSYDQVLESEKKMNTLLKQAIENLKV